MSMYRFFASPLAAAGELSSDQAHHARDVLRLSADESVVLFDGHGNWAAATLNIQKRHAGYTLLGPIQHDPPPRFPITIASAVPKADRANVLLEQISQLGVARLIWLDCRYSVVHPSADAGKMEKWQRLAIESAKQCGRSRVLVIDPPRTPDQLVLHPEFQSTMIWTHLDSTDTLRQRLKSWKDRQASDAAGDCNNNLTILIGPEGGWSDRECQLLRAIAEPVRLGQHILRIETAATTAAAITQAVLAEEPADILPHRRC
jgi:16S rRNA (uracil1498-N3)-methyltransferase